MFCILPLLHKCCFSLTFSYFAAKFSGVCISVLHPYELGIKIHILNCCATHKPDSISPIDLKNISSVFYILKIAYRLIHISPFYLTL